MLRRAVWGLMLGCLIAGDAGLARAEVWVAEAVVTTEIHDRVPVDEVQTYSATVGELYCFTRIAGAEHDMQVSHVWYYRDREVARVLLPIRSSNWRTWSRKTVPDRWTGDWRVEILDEQGVVLTKVGFRLI